MVEETEDNCWVCEAWIETIISVDLNALGVPYEAPKDPNQLINVYIHFDFDNFQPNLMDDLHLNGRPQNLGLFQIFRMLPQQTALYFFSLDGKPFLSNTPTVAIDRNIAKEVNQTFKSRQLRNDIANTDELVDFKLKEMNVAFGSRLVFNFLASRQLRTEEKSWFSPADLSKDRPSSSETTEHTECYQLISPKYEV